MAKLYPYLTFKNTKEAQNYYEQVFQAKYCMRTPVSKEMASGLGLDETKLDETTMHGYMQVLGCEILMSDRFGDKPEFSETMSLCLDCDSEDASEFEKMENLYQQVIKDEATKIVFPFEKQFWGGAMGRVIDRYGVAWMFHAQPYSKLK